MENIEIKVTKDGEVESVNQHDCDVTVEKVGKGNYRLSFDNPNARYFFFSYVANGKNGELIFGNNLISATVLPSRLVIEAWLADKASTDVKSCTIMNIVELNKEDYKSYCDE